MNIESDSSYYTVAALVAAVLLPSFYDLGRRIWEALSEEEEKTGDSKAKQNMSVEKNSNEEKAV